MVVGIPVVRHKGDARGTSGDMRLHDHILGSEDDAGRWLVYGLHCILVADVYIYRRGGCGIVPSSHGTTVRTRGREWRIK